MFVFHAPLDEVQAAYVDQVRRIAPPDLPEGGLAALPAQAGHESRENPSAAHIFSDMRGEFGELHHAAERALTLAGAEAGVTSTDLVFESFEIRPSLVTFSVNLHASRQRVLLQISSNAYLSAAERGQFIADIGQARRFSHQRAARILDGNFTDLGYPFVVQLIDKEAAPVQPPLTAAEVIDIGRKMADALDVAHSKGVTFGVIEPSHILLTPGGEPILTFPHLPRFTSAADGTDAAARDVFSLCATLLALLPGLRTSHGRAVHGDTAREAGVRKVLAAGMQANPELRPNASVLRDKFYELLWQGEESSSNGEFARRIPIAGRFGPLTAEIFVHTGDLFDEAADLVVSFSDTFDTDTRIPVNHKRPIISPTSLQAQLAEQMYGADIEALDRDLDRALAATSARMAESRASKSLGKLKRYNVGTIAVLECSERKIFAIAVSRMGNDLIAESDYESIEQSLRQLWVEIRRQKCSSVAMSIIGSGLARVDVRPYILFKLIWSSFQAHTYLEPICPELRVVIRPTDRKTIKEIDEALSAEGDQGDRSRLPSAGL